MRKLLENSSNLKMSPTSKDKQEMRVIIGKDTYRLLKKLAGIREISLSRLAEEAFDRYLEDEDTKELIDRHKLED